MAIIELPVFAKVIKTILFGLIAAILVLLVLILLGSRDITTYDSRGLMETLPNILDEHNGLTAIKYTQEKSNEFLLSDDERKKLSEHVDGIVWDEGFVTSILSTYKKYIDDVKKVVAYPKFFLPKSENTTEFPEYLPLIVMFNLVLLSAIDEEHSGKFGEAISNLDIALKFAQKIKTEEATNLISAMIGLRLQHRAIRRIHFLSNNVDLSMEQLVRLQSMLGELPAYHEDGFEKVFDGEFFFAIAYQREFLSKNFKQRISEYWNDEDWMSRTYQEVSDDESELVRALFRLGNVLAPRFYMHGNRSLDIVALHYANTKRHSSKYCTCEIELQGNTHWDEEVTWKDLFRPNSNGVNSFDDLYNFEEYFKRRCMAHAYVQAVRAAIAIQSYQRERGNYPESLELLLPNYIDELPVDPFSGEVMKYSRQHEWLYSIGTNHEDNGGDSKSMYYYRCPWDDQCSENPTFPIYAEFLSKEEG